MKNIDDTIILSCMIVQMLKETKNKNVYKTFFAKFNRYYDLEHIEGYDVVDIAFLTIEQKDTLYNLIDTKTNLNELCTFVGCCNALIHFIGE